jgi:hypothetical protein
MEHPQNPRSISESAKKKLKDKMKDVGLLQPLIVNRTTGYLLSGHQRLSSLDSLERYKAGHNDYSLDVAMVELDVKAELEMLVFLNNPSAMGAWNIDILGELGTVGSFEDMGFDRIDVETMFSGDARYDSLFEDTVQTGEVKNSLDSIKADRKAMREDQTIKQSVDYYVTVVCKDQAEKEKLMKHLGIPKGEIYISPSEILSLQRRGA